MKQLIGYLKRFYHEEFDWRYGLLVLLYASLLLYINFGDTYFSQHKAVWRGRLETSWLYYFVVYGIALLPPFMFYLFHKSTRDILKQKGLWCLCLLGIMIFASRGAWYFFFDQYIASSWDRSTPAGASIYRIVYTLFKSIIALAPVLLYWYWVDKKDQPFYGMKRKGLDLKPYLILLMLLVPFVAIASQEPSFLRKYPRIQVIDAIDLFNPKMAKWILSYEGLYILDFYVIELFFRGFMILAFVKFCGPKSILPVAVFYCAIHFNKPMPEAISSFFGGTILGIITYYSRSIWGGIIIHMGIAAVMEVGAYVGHWLQR